MNTINPDDENYASSVQSLHVEEHNPKEEEDDQLQTLEPGNQLQDPPKITSENVGNEDSRDDGEDFEDSQDESRQTTIYADMHGAIDEDQQVNVRHSAISVAKIDDAVQIDLKEEEDDFMDTYLAVKLDVKVRESQLSPQHRQARKVDKSDSQLTSRYHSRLSAKSPTTKNQPRPLTKNREKTASQLQSSRARSNSQDEIQPTIEENFEQYSALPVEEIDKLAFDRNSIEESFNQYENLDKFLENDRKQEERRQIAKKQIHDYKMMAIEQQRSQRQT